MPAFEQKSAKNVNFVSVSKPLKEESSKSSTLTPYHLRIMYAINIICSCVYKLTAIRGDIFKLLRSPVIGSKESILPAFAAWRAAVRLSYSSRYVYPIPYWLL
jgi:hypothetical protein